VYYANRLKMSTSRIFKVVKDPFFVLAALVVLVPAGFIVYATNNVQEFPQAHTSSAPNTTTNQSEPTDLQEKETEKEKPAAPISKAQPTPVKKPQLTPHNKAVAAKKTSEPSCNQTLKKQAITEYNLALSKENDYYQRQISKLWVRLIPGRLSEEKARHTGAVQAIKTDYTKALEAANC